MPRGGRAARGSRPTGDRERGVPPVVRRGEDRLYPQRLGPRELEALRLVGERPGISVAELRGPGLCGDDLASS